MTPVNCTYLRPAEVDAASAAVFKQLVLQAGQVNRAAFPGLYKRTLVLAFARVDGHIAGVGAIKRPNQTHRDKVFRKAKSAISPARFVYELAWFHVLKKFEGNRICSHMVAGLMPWAEDNAVYATSAINNHAMHSALTKHGGFIREGSDYAPEENDVPIRLFIRRVPRTPTAK